MTSMSALASLSLPLLDHEFEAPEVVCFTFSIHHGELSQETIQGFGVIVSHQSIKVW